MMCHVAMREIHCYVRRLNAAATAKEDAIKRLKAAKAEEKGLVARRSAVQKAEEAAASHLVRIISSPAHSTHPHPSRRA